MCWVSLNSDNINSSIVKPAYLVIVSDGLAQLLYSIFGTCRLESLHQYNWESKILSRIHWDLIIYLQHLG